MKRLLIACGAVALLWCAFPIAAHADVRVFFTEMAVNDCNEIGTCDWKLSCGLGNQQETEFFSMSEANTNEAVTINRALTQREFPPVTVTCTVMEHDGGIGAEWEQVGSGSVVVRTTGSHLIRLNQHRDEGDVTVKFTVESIGSTSQPLTTGFSGGGVPIRSGAGKCLDVHAPDQNNNGARVQVWDCNGSVQQSWRYKHGAIRSAANLCLDVHAPDQRNNGGRVQVWACNGSPQQTWSLQGGAIRSGAGKCLDVHAPDQGTNGGRVQVWDCNGSQQQRWSMQGQIMGAAGLCLDVHAPDQRNNGAKVQVWQCNGSQQQAWRFDNGAIRSAAGKCLDVHAPDQRNNGGRVQVWDCNGSPQQAWSATGREIRSGAGMCLDVHAPDQASNGGRVQVWACNGSQQQTWSMP